MRWEWLAAWCAAVYVLHALEVRRRLACTAWDMAHTLSFLGRNPLSQYQDLIDRFTQNGAIAPIVMAPGWHPHQTGQKKSNRLTNKQNEWEGSAVLTCPLAGRRKQRKDSCPARRAVRGQQDSMREGMQIWASVWSVQMGWSGARGFVHGMKGGQG